MLSLHDVEEDENLYDARRIYSGRDYKQLYVLYIRTLVSNGRMYPPHVEICKDDQLLAEYVNYSYRKLSEYILNIAIDSNDIKLWKYTFIMIKDKERYMKHIYKNPELIQLYNGTKVPLLQDYLSMSVYELNTIDNLGNNPYFLLRWQRHNKMPFNIDSLSKLTKEIEGLNECTTNISCLNQAITNDDIEKVKSLTQVYRFKEGDILSSNIKSISIFDTIISIISPDYMARFIYSVLLSSLTNNSDELCMMLLQKKSKFLPRYEKRSHESDDIYKHKLAQILSLITNALLHSSLEVVKDITVLYIKYIQDHIDEISTYVFKSANIDKIEYMSSIIDLAIDDNVYYSGDIEIVLKYGRDDINWVRAMKNLCRTKSRDALTMLKMVINKVDKPNTKDIGLCVQFALIYGNYDMIPYLNRFKYYIHPNIAVIILNSFVTKNSSAYTNIDRRGFELFMSMFQGEIIGQKYDVNNMLQVYATNLDDDYYYLESLLKRVKNPNIQALIDVAGSVLNLNIRSALLYNNI